MKTFLSSYELMCVDSCYTRFNGFQKTNLFNFLSQFAHLTATF